MSWESSGVLQGKGSSQWDCWRDEGVTDSGAAGMLRAWSSISSSPRPGAVPALQAILSSLSQRTGISGEQGAGAGLGLDLGILS